MPNESSNQFTRKNVLLRRYPPQDGITLTVSGEIGSQKPMTITIENDKSELRVKVDAAFCDSIVDEIDWIKNRELLQSSKNIFQQIRSEKSGLVVMREAEPYEGPDKIKERYTIGDGKNCNYAFSTAMDLENFFSRLKSGDLS